MTAAVVWFTGLSGSGKSTLAESLQDALRARGATVSIVDGDQLRDSRSRPLGFTREDIVANGLSAVGLAKESLASHEYVIVSLITPLEEVRREARARLSPHYFEVYVNTSVETCRARDTKGLYARADRGEITNLIGVSSATPFEVPSSPDFVAQTEGSDVEGLTLRLVAELDEWRSRDPVGVGGQR